MGYITVLHDDDPAISITRLFPDNRRANKNGMVNIKFLNGNSNGTTP